MGKRFRRVRPLTCDEAGMSLHWPLPRLRHVPVRKRSPHTVQALLTPLGYKEDIDRFRAVPCVAELPVSDLTQLV